MGVAVHTFKVAAPGHVPDYNRLLVGRKLQEVGGQLAGMNGNTFFMFFTFVASVMIDFLRFLFLFVDFLVKIWLL